MDSILCISRLVEAAVRKMYFKVDVLKFRNIRKETPLLQWNCNCEYCDVFRTVFFKTSGGCFCNEFLGNQDLKYMIEKKKKLGHWCRNKSTYRKMDILGGKSWFYQNSLIVTCFLYFLNLSKPLVDFWLVVGGLEGGGR